jgi:putative transposase
MRGRDDALVQVSPLLQLVHNWRRLLTRVLRDEDLEALRAHERTGRPLGDDTFLTSLEKKLGRILKRQKPGPKGKAKRSIENSSPRSATGAQRWPRDGSSRE